MSRTLGGLSRTAALLLLALPAATQDDPARFPAASSRAELQARRAWYLWSAQSDPQQAVTELQQALQAAADDPARTAALNFYVAVALERNGNPEAWQKQLRQLEALGVEPYASWAAAQAEAPAALPAQQDPEPRAIPSYLQRWADNLDEDEHLKNTQEAREELRRLGVLAVPAILAKLPDYGVLGLRHATELLLPHADERVLRALEQRMLAGDESALYVIATAVETLPAEPRHRLGAIALHSPSLPAAIHGAACCADAPEQRARVLEVLGQALQASSTKVRNVALAVLAMKGLGDEEQVRSWIEEVLKEGDDRQREALVEFWMNDRKQRSEAEQIWFHSQLSDRDRHVYWGFRLRSGAGLLALWELERALLDGAPLNSANSLASGTSQGPTAPGSLPPWSSRVSELLLREPPLPRASVDWVLGRSMDGPTRDGFTLSPAAALRYVDDPDPGFAYRARVALVAAAPVTAMQRLPIGDPRSGGIDAQVLNSLRRELPMSLEADDIPAVLDYLRRLDEVQARLNDVQARNQLRDVTKMLAALTGPEHLEALLRVCRLDGPSSPELRWNLGQVALPPAPQTPEQAQLVLDALPELPAPMADRLAPRLPEAVDASCTEALLSALRRTRGQHGEGGPVDPSNRAYYESRIAGKKLVGPLLEALHRCGEPGRAALMDLLRDAEFGTRSLLDLLEGPNPDPITLARTVFTPPGNPALYGAFLRQPGTFGYDAARFRALLDDSVRPHVRNVLASLIEHGEIEARAFLDALPRQERIDTCRDLLEAAVGRSDLVDAQLDLVREALRSLGALQDPALAETFALAFQSPSQDLRLLAIDQLASMLSPLAAPVLLRALDDPDRIVRDTAHNALSTLQSHQENKRHWQEWIEQNAPGKGRKDG